MKYRYIFVDLDNTLLDFEAAEEYSFYYTAQSHGLTFGEAELERYKAINAPLWKMMERREITKAALVVRRFRRDCSGRWAFPALTRNSTMPIT